VPSRTERREARRHAGLADDELSTEVASESSRVSEFKGYPVRTQARLVIYRSGMRLADRRVGESERSTVLPLMFDRQAGVRDGIQAIRLMINWP